MIENNQRAELQEAKKKLQEAFEETKLYKICEKIVIGLDKIMKWVGENEQNNRK